MTLHIEATGNVLASVRHLTGEIPGSDARMLREYFENGAMFAVKAALRLAGIAGGAGLVLALAGLYGAVSSTVARRRREIAIRISLGAHPAGVFAMIVRQGMALALLGAAAGLIAGGWGSRLLRGLVPGSGGSFWMVYAGAAGLILAASVIACAIPAVTALRFDPASILREDSI